MRLSDFKVLTFDCYGTLIDWEAGMIAALGPLTQAVADKSGRALPRDAILEAHAAHEAAQQRLTPAMPYRDLLAIVHERLAREWGVTVRAEDCRAYGRSVGTWPAFGDSAAALSDLKERFKLVILSNVDNASFALSNARLGVTFDAVYTAEDIGSYKPNARNFAYMIEHLARDGIPKGAILHVAESLFHDHVPAKAAGLATCWIHRRHAQPGFGATLDPGSRPTPDFTFTSLREMAAATRP